MESQSTKSCLTKSQQWHDTELGWCLPQHGESGKLCNRDDTFNVTLEDVWCLNVFDVGTGPVLTRAPGSGLIPSWYGLVDPAQVALDVGVDARNVWPSAPDPARHDTKNCHLLVMLRYKGTAAVALEERSLRISTQIRLKWLKLPVYPVVFWAWILSMRK